MTGPQILRCKHKDCGKPLQGHFYWLGWLAFCLEHAPKTAPVEPAHTEPERKPKQETML